MNRVQVLAAAACLLLVVALGVVVTGLISELKGITDVTEAAFGALAVMWLVGQWVLAGLTRRAAGGAR